MTDVHRGTVPSVDEITPTTPDTPRYREGAALFVWDDEDRFGVPRVGVEAVGATWETARGYQITIQQPDGRTLAVNASAPPHPVHDDRGRPRVFGAGPLRFTCLEPFERWRVVFDGDAVETTVDAVRAGGPPSSPGAGTRGVAVRLDIDAGMAAPPWELGTRRPEGSFPPAGEHRFEQLFTATGTLHVDGAGFPFTGGGLRIHRKGGDRGSVSDFHGHCWQTGLFPSGRAFGFIHYHPRPDGSVKYYEGWLRDAGETVPARIVATPWMRPGAAWRGEDVSFTLRTPEREVRIEAETSVSWFKPGRPDGWPELQAGITRCRWDGETGRGMIERTPVGP